MEVPGGGPVRGINSATSPIAQGNVTVRTGLRGGGGGGAGNRG